jgi:hypothetical protein
VLTSRGHEKAILSLLADRRPTPISFSPLPLPEYISTFLRIGQNVSRPRSFAIFSIAVFWLWLLRLLLAFGFLPFYSLSHLHDTRRCTVFKGKWESILFLYRFYDCLQGVF